MQLQHQQYKKKLNTVYMYRTQPEKRLLLSDVIKTDMSCIGPNLFLKAKVVLPLGSPSTSHNEIMSSLCP